MQGLFTWVPGMSGATPARRETMLKPSAMIIDAGITHSRVSSRLDEPWSITTNTNREGQRRDVRQLVCSNGKGVLQQYEGTVSRRGLDLALLGLCSFDIILRTRSPGTGVPAAG